MAHSPTQEKFKLVLRESFMCESVVALFVASLRIVFSFVEATGYQDRGDSGDQGKRKSEFQKLFRWMFAFRV